MATTEDQARAQLGPLSGVLDHRVPQAQKLDEYAEGEFPLPPLIQDERVTRAYRKLMGLSTSNWPKLIVDSAEERIEVQGVRFGDADADQDVWDIWQANGLDAESSMLHQSVLTTGRGYAIVWGDGSRDPQPKITYEHASTCAVEYQPGSRRQRRSAIRRWRENGVWCANLYRPEAIYKFQAPDDADGVPAADKWVRRVVANESWPLVNPLGEVPVVEFAVNRTLRPAQFGTGQGEFATHLDHIDRINYKTFCGLVALTWSGFPLRALIGLPIRWKQNADGTDATDPNTGQKIPLPPFDVVSSSITQIEDPNGKLVQLPEANVGNYSPAEDIKHLAALTKTPAHYLLGEMVNLSADAIRAGEAALISKVRSHHRSLGESHEEVARLALRVKNPDDPRGHDQSAQIIWRDPESRSLAERADAAVKLAKTALPWQVIASMVLGMTPQEITRAEAGRSSDAMTALLEAAKGTANGNGQQAPAALSG